jgi:hypothetical protein
MSIDIKTTSINPVQVRCFEDHIFMEAFLTAEDGAKPARRSALFKKF